MPESLFQQSCRPEAWNFINKNTLAQVLLCEFCEISKYTFLNRARLGDYFIVCSQFINRLNLYTQLCDIALYGASFFKLSCTNKLFNSGMYSYLSELL